MFGWPWTGWRVLGDGGFQKDRPGGGQSWVVSLGDTGETTPPIFGR